MKKLNFRLSLLVVLVVSLSFNFLVFAIDTLPFIMGKMKSRYQPVPRHNSEVSSLDVFESSLRMVKSKDIYTVWYEYSGVTERLYNIFRPSLNEDFKIYNYPRAFLYYGLSEYILSNDLENKYGAELKELFDQLVLANGTPNFTFDKVDQVPFGLAAINMYKMYNDKKYQLFYHYVFEWIRKNTNKGGIILYRDYSDNQLNDVLGLVVPFLIQYYNETGNPLALSMARKQLAFFIDNGVDSQSSLPSHGFSLKNKVKTGSANWGRGIGWYLLAVSALYEGTGEYYDELISAYNSLLVHADSTQMFSQFPGSSDRFDASTSTMLIYSFLSLPNSKYHHNDHLGLFSNYLDQNGRLLSTSGDTYDLNRYSSTFGKSELSQGMLLLILSKKY